MITRTHRIEFTSDEKTILLDALLSEYYACRDDAEMRPLCTEIEDLSARIEKA